METNNPNISEKDRNSILNHIINCANCALQNEDVFQKAMLELATTLRNIFDSEYCSIGIVDGDYAEDCVISLEKFEDEEQSRQQQIFLDSVKRASIEDDKCTVCLALRSTDDIYRSIQEKLNESNNYKYYHRILTSGTIKDSCVIPIRDHEKNNYGFIQFINTEKSIDFERDILPYEGALLGLVQVIINNKNNQKELAKKENLLKDADFYNLMQDKRDNVNDLLDRIMEYFSEQFNAAVISFRIPVLNGYKKEPLFYLRRVFFHSSVKKQKEVVNQYYDKRFARNREEMKIADDLRCDNQGKILQSISDTNFSRYGLDLYENTLIMPIIRDNNLKCIHPDKEDQDFCKPGDHKDCPYRFKRFYGLFRLKISKKDLNRIDDKSNYQYDIDDTIKRLLYLSKQISLLLNSIVEKYENESLKTFQNELKNSSFIKIKEFDERCVDIIRKSVDAKVCSIYRYHELTKQLALSATTAKKIRFNGIVVDKNAVFNNCFIPITARKNLLVKVFSDEQNRSKCVFNIYDTEVHPCSFIETIDNETYDRFTPTGSAIIVPMFKKDSSCAGVVLLIGKEKHKHSISTAFWEHDLEHIEFIVNILTRISESNTERLTFLSQLSHELLSPVTELVYDNDLTVNLAERTPQSFSRRKLITKIRENIDRNILFKYIISDTEFIYSSGGKSIDYNIVKQDRPQRILLDAIRLMEKDAKARGLTIRTNISNMPTLYFDKERMMQVFLNLLKNAIRYSDQFTTIDIYYKRGDDGSHEIRFANNGIGIKEEEKESIFELFHRGEAAKKRFTRGTGMGLYIVRDIMKAHGGDCYVKQLNNPTEFVITLPNKE